MCTLLLFVYGFNFTFTLTLCCVLPVPQAEVRKIFRTEDSQADFASKEVSPLSEIIQEILQRHMQGTKFRERGAGPNLDRDMTPPGFNVSIGVDENTGFVYGGSVYNCGTWMDKVGESSWARNKGVPATPRYVRVYIAHYTVCVCTCIFSHFKIICKLLPMPYKAKKRQHSFTSIHNISVHYMYVCTCMYVHVYMTL